MPGAIGDLISRPGSRVGHHFLKGFDIQPNVIIYHSHVDHGDNKSSDAKHLKSGPDDVSSAQQTEGSKTRTEGS